MWFFVFNVCTSAVRRLINIFFGMYYSVCVCLSAQNSHNSFFPIGNIPICPSWNAYTIRDEQRRADAFAIRRCLYNARIVSSTDFDHNIYTLCSAVYTHRKCTWKLHRRILPKTNRFVPTTNFPHSTLSPHQKPHQRKIRASPHPARHVNHLFLLILVLLTIRDVRLMRLELRFILRIHDVTARATRVPMFLYLHAEIKMDWKFANRCLDVDLAWHGNGTVCVPVQTVRKTIYIW